MGFSKNNAISIIVIVYIIPSSWVILPMTLFANVVYFGTQCWLIATKTVLEVKFFTKESVTSTLILRPALVIVLFKSSIADLFLFLTF
uniref:hypothetical protein n=1 Tax=Peribacillus sp. TH27 TaxID=2798484 RepID=UPI001F5BFB81|nr:hypothetical protein [Peribacillus sp. TH27]